MPACLPPSSLLPPCLGSSPSLLRHRLHPTPTAQLKSTSIPKDSDLAPTIPKASCLLQDDALKFPQTCAPVSKLAAITLAVSALILSGANAEDPPKRFSYDELQSLTSMKVKAVRIANHCPVIKGGTGYFAFKPGTYQIKKLCLEPTSFRVKSESPVTEDYRKAKLVARLTYTLDEVEGPLEVNSDGTLKFREKEGLDHATVTVQFQRGERVPLVFTIKDLAVGGKPEKLEGQFLVPEDGGSSFLEPKGGGGSQSYDHSVAFPAGDAGNEEREKKENLEGRTASTTTIGLNVAKSNIETGELSGAFQSVKPSDTLGPKAAKEVKFEGIWYVQLE